MRFNHFFRDGQLHYRGGVPLTAAGTLAPLMAELGWHLQLWIDVKDLPETIPVLKSLGLPVVIDHMGRTDARAGTATEGFQSLLRAVGEGWCWAKLSGAHRLSRDAPDYPDARPFHEALVGANPERLVWGGDWPHPARRGRDARCRPLVRIVSAMDAGPGDTAPHAEHGDLNEDGRDDEAHDEGKQHSATLQKNRPGL